jgi:hypothetical protein
MNLATEAQIDECVNGKKNFFIRNYMHCVYTSQVQSGHRHCIETALHEPVKFRCIHGWALHLTGIASNRHCIEPALHRTGFTSNRLYIEQALHRTGIASNRQCIEPTLHRTALHRTGIASADANTTG